jgi:hypothetical protein
MQSITWRDILDLEKCENLYPMHHRPNPTENYSIFLISDESQYEDILHNTKTIDYEGTEKAVWINEKFFNLANSSPKENIKIYYKQSTNNWHLKGFYILQKASIEQSGKFRFWLEPK